MAILHLRALIAAALIFLAAPARAWTDDPLRPGITPVRAAHLREIGSAVNAKLASCGLPPTGVPSPGATIRAADVNAARASVTSLYLSFSRPAPSYSDGASLSSGSPIRVAHLAELRADVDAAASWSCPVHACVPDGSCSAGDPACGTTTSGIDNCGNACSRAGAACAACVPDGSCSAAVPACEATTNGTDNCGNSCSRTGAACQACSPDCSDSGSYFTCQTFPDGCGGVCRGTRRCACNFVREHNLWICATPAGDLCGAAGVICAGDEGCVCGF